MAVGVKPGFVSGANARVKLDGLTLAYCTDMSYTVDMATVPIEAIGSYEVKSYEPIAYAVSGNFSVIRYTSKITPTKGKASGNPAEELGSDNKVALHLDPGRVLTSSTFDMEIFQSTAATTAIQMKQCNTLFLRFMIVALLVVPLRSVSVVSWLIRMHSLESWLEILMPAFKQHQVVLVFKT